MVELNGHDMPTVPGDAPSRRPPVPSEPALLAAIVDSSDDGIVSKTLEGVITSWNRGAERIFGYAANEAIGQHISILFPPERLPEEVHLLGEIAAGRRVEHFETRRRHKQGHLLSVSVSLSPVRDQAGTIVGASKIVRDISARTALEEQAALAQRQLRESRDVLALAMQGGRMGAWTRDLTSGRVWWSRELESLFGLAPGQFDESEEGFLAKVHADDRTRLEQAVADSIRSTKEYVVEFRFRHASGDWRWMEGRGRAGYASNGTPLSLYGVGIDISQRKKYEAALGEARVAADADAERLNLAMNAAGLGDWSWDAASDMVTMSSRAADIFDIPPGPHMTWTAMRTLIHPEDRERTRLAVENSIADRTEYSTEYRLINGGRERWVAASGRARYDNVGVVLGMLGVVQDVTIDRLLVHLDDAVRHLDDPQLVTATAAALLGAHLKVNRCAYASVGDDQDSFVIVGNYTDQALSSVGRYHFHDFGEEVLRLMRRGLPYIVSDTDKDMRVTAADRPAYERMAIRAIICVPILKRDRFVAAMAVHMTSPRNWEPREIELVQQVASRCWESIERARIEGERLNLLEAAEAANRAKDEFMAMLGHELRNPLSPIVTALHLMKLRGDGSSERERTVIERQVAHMTRLVDDLLDVSRIARGKVELQAGIVELAEIVATAIEISSPLLEQRAQQLIVEVPRSGLTVRGDAIRLRQVVVNLLTNAAKYTPTGGRVTVTGEAQAADVVLRVKDTGIGMTPELLPRVFDLFMQGRQNLDRAEGGLGLGLTIVRSLVERHGGSVSATSAGPGHGSEFVVTLPAIAVLPPEASVSVPAGPADRPAAHARLLIVDDNEDSADLLAEAFHMLGHVVHVAHHGRDALRLARATPLDAALLDIGLPDMDGYELARRLRQLPHCAGICLIAVTGYGQDPDRRRANAAGFDHHVVKPVDLATLEGLVRDFLVRQE